MRITAAALVKASLSLFLIEMFLFPALFHTSLPYVTELTTLFSLFMIVLDCFQRKDLFTNLFNGVKGMAVYVLYILYSGAVMMFTSRYSITKIVPAFEMIVLLIIVIYIAISDGNMEFIAFLGILMATVLGICGITQGEELNMRLELASNLSANVTGLLLIFGILCTYLTRSRFFNSYIKLAINIICLMAIVLTASRQALLLAAIIYVAWIIRTYKIYRDPKKIGKINPKGIVFVLVCVLVFFGLRSAGYFEELEATKLFDRLTGENVATEESDEARGRLYEVGWEAFIESPIFGCGYDNLKAYTHSTYMEVLGGTGLIGFMLFYFPFFGRIKKCIVGLRKQDPLRKGVYYDQLTIIIVLFAMMFFRAVHYYIVSQIIIGLIFTNAELLQDKKTAPQTH